MAPLSDIRVLDFTTLVPGPIATLMMAEAGADVIKVERPGVGDEMRSYTPRLGASSANFALLNRGKRSVSLDLKDERDRAQLDRLLPDTDVLVEQFRPGVMERLGLGYETVKAVNPDIIYCSLSGYGQTGERADKAGHDLTYQAETGILALGAPGLVPNVLVADIAGGAYPALINILIALRQRELTGEGAWLDIAMSDNLFTLGYWAQANVQAGQLPPEPGAELVTGGSPRYRLYETADGHWVAAAPLEDRFWTRFCSLIDLPEALRDDTVDPEATTSAVADIFSQRTARQWEEVFADEDVCCAVVVPYEQALADPHFQQRGLFNRATANGTSESIAALPTPLSPAFHDGGSRPWAPGLNEDAAEWRPRSR